MPAPMTPFMWVPAFAAGGRGRRNADIDPADEPFPKEAKYIFKTVEKGIFRPTIVDTPCEIKGRDATRYQIRVFRNVWIPGGEKVFLGSIIWVPRSSVVPADQPIPLWDE